MKLYQIILALLLFTAISACKDTTPPPPDVDITNIYSETLPATCFIGKAYTNNDIKDGSFSSQWETWFVNNWFTPLENLQTTQFIEEYPDATAYIGLEQIDLQTQTLTYYIGMFLPPETTVPEGYSHIDFVESTLGVVWIYGFEPDIYHNEELAFYKLIEEGFTPMLNIDGTQWIFERYADDRFFPDENGKTTLDICFFVE